DRHGVRTPMQWSADRNAGFSSSNPQRLYLPVIIDPEYHYETVNVEVQQRNTSSLLWWMRKTISFRNKHKAFGRGSIEFLSPANSKVLAFIRRYEDEVILVVANLSRFSQVVELDLSQFKGNTPIEVFSRNEFPPIGEFYYMLTLSAFDYYWFKISDKEKINPVLEKDIPRLEIRDKIEEIFEEDNIETLEYEIIPDSLGRMQISLDKSKIQDVQLVDIILLSKNIFMLIVKINYLDKPAELYSLFLGIVHDLPYDIKDADPREISAVLQSVEENKYLVNCFYNEELRKQLLQFFVSKKSFPGSKGELQVSLQEKIKSSKTKKFSVRIYNESQDFISFLVDETYAVKFYKKIDEGINPEEETLEYFKEETDYSLVPSLKGALKYASPATENLTLGILTEYIRNEGDAWKFFSDLFDNYFERLAVRKDELKEIKFIDSLFDKNFETGLFEEFADNVSNGMSALLGQRTAEMHLALTSPDNPLFKAEPVTVFYQRSIYQSMRSIVKNTFRLLRSNVSQFENNLQPLVQESIKKEEMLLVFMERILKIKFNASKIRIHGNYNLKQVLFTGKDFVITNFEGQTSIPFTERKLKRSPLRDISSLIFSFHTLTNNRLHKQTSFGSEDRETAEFFAEQWWLSISSILLTKYFKIISSDKNNVILNAEKDDSNYLVLVYLFEKVLVDLAYALNIDADWKVQKLKALILLFKHIEYFRNPSDGVY
ncbi:MAG: hypothetical protein EHM47_11100, partial [Ignavibacteriales bacterium]